MLLLRAYCLGERPGRSNIKFRDLIGSSTAEKSRPSAAVRQDLRRSFPFWESFFFFPFVGPRLVSSDSSSSIRRLRSSTSLPGTAVAATGGLA